MDGVVSMATFSATCKFKRPELTEDKIPTMNDIKRGGYGTCVICLRPDFSMYALRNHVESRHSVKIGDPLNVWLRAAERWD